MSTSKVLKQSVLSLRQEASVLGSPLERLGGEPGRRNSSNPKIDAHRINSVDSIFDLSPEVKLAWSLLEVPLRFRSEKGCDLDPATIRRWRREGAPSHVLGNGLIRYRLSELEKWRASRGVK